MFFLCSEGDSLSGQRLGQSVGMCATSGRKPLHEQHRLIVYQPLASNKDLLKTPTVDNTSSVALEPDDKCNSEENSSVPVVQQR